MVPQATDKFNEYTSHQHQLSIKKVALMDLPTTSENISKPAENSPFTKGRESMTDSVKPFGTKRRQPDSPSSPSSHQPIINKGVNGHIVYVRRKIDTEKARKNSSNIADSSSSSIFLRKLENEETKYPEAQQDIIQRCSEISHSIGLVPKDSAVTATTKTPDNPEKSNNRELNSQRMSYQLPDAPIDSERSSDEKCKAPVDGQKSSDQDCEAPIHSQRSSYQCSTAPIDPQMSSDQKCKASANPQKLTYQDSKDPVDAQRPINQDWKERYLNLQRFLKDCDQSSQDDYKRMLRSLTSAGRSKHALELEKRAWHLLLEEGKELNRMQALNSIGEVAMQYHASPSTRTSASPSQFQRMETMNNPKSSFLRNGH